MTTVILGLCVVISTGAASVATANFTDYVMGCYREYVEEHKELYTFGDPAVFETPDGVTVVVEGGVTE